MKTKTLERLDSWRRQYVLRSIWLSLEKLDADRAMKIAVGSAEVKAREKIPYKGILRESIHWHRERLKEALDAAIAELQNLRDGF